MFINNQQGRLKVCRLKSIKSIKIFFILDVFLKKYYNTLHKALQLWRMKKKMKKKGRKRKREKSLIT